MVAFGNFHAQSGELIRMRLSPLIRKVHIYAGLQAAVALLLFSITVIALSLSSKDTKTKEVSFYQYTGNLSLESTSLAQAVHDQVGLRFEKRPQWWMISETPDNHLIIKNYSAQSSREIQLNKSTGEIKITSKPLSLAEMANYLHLQNLGSRKTSDSLWLWAWSIYIDISVASILILPISGLYIWVTSRSYKKIWAKGSLLISSALMVILWSSLR